MKHQRQTAYRPPQLKQQSTKPHPATLNEWRLNQAIARIKVRATHSAAMQQRITAWQDGLVPFAG